MPYKQDAFYTTPTDNTHYLVGAEGLVWVQPAIGEPFIIAANSEQQRADVADFIWGLLNLGLVPYGLTLNHKQQVAMFGGQRLRGCHWVRHTEAPSPSGDDGDTLPTRPAIIIVAEPADNNGERTRHLAAHAANMAKGVDKNDPDFNILLLAAQMVRETGCHVDTARRHLNKALGIQIAKPQGGKRTGAGRPRKNK